MSMQSVNPSDTVELLRAAILDNLDNPGQLEQLYRQNKSLFQRAFKAAYPDIRQHAVAQTWYERLNFRQDEISWGSNRERTFIVIAILIAGFIAKIPDFTGIDEDFFFPRNISLIVLPLLTAYFSWRQQLNLRQWLVPLMATAVSAVYINLLPNDDYSDTIILACIHLPLFLWVILGYAYLGNQYNSSTKRIDFLRFNGDLVVISAVIALSGALFTGVTLGLFQLIDIDIEEFYFKYVAVWGLPAVPIVGTFLVQNNPQLVSKISPVIARIFTPLVFLTLLIFLIAVIYSGKDPYNDREFLLLFNILLITVMALILFSLGEATRQTGQRVNLLFLFGLSVLAIIDNGIALSAIAFRLFEYGLTPNRVAVMGGNLLILINLLLVAYQLGNVLRGREEIEKVERSMAVYMPVYGLWTAIIIFLLPVLFGFK